MGENQSWSASRLAGAVISTHSNYRIIHQGENVISKVDNVTFSTKPTFTLQNTVVYHDQLIELYHVDVAAALATLFSL